MYVKILCALFSLATVNIVHVILKIYNTLLSLENEETHVIRTVFAESKASSTVFCPVRPVDWRIVHTLGWLLGMGIIITEALVIYDSVSCFLIPLKAYLQSGCFLSIFCFASALSMYELDMAIYMPWLPENQTCTPHPESPFAPPWASWPFPTGTSGAGCPSGMVIPSNFPLNYNVPGGYFPPTFPPTFPSTFPTNPRTGPFFPPTHPGQFFAMPGGFMPIPFSNPITPQLGQTTCSIMSQPLCPIIAQYPEGELISKRVQSAPRSTVVIEENLPPCE